MAETLNQTRMADSCEISARNFAHWKVEPVATEGRQKLYTVRAVLDNRLAAQAATYQTKIDRLQERIRELETAEDGRTLPEVMHAQQVERTRLLEAQADAQELKNQMARHEIAPFDFFTFVLAGIANHIAGVMDSIPSQMLRKLALKPQQLDKVRGITAAASEAIVTLGSEEWVTARYDEYLKENHQPRRAS